MSRLRLMLEILGALLYAGAHVPLAVVYALGSSLPVLAPGLYWASLAAGYLGMAALLVVRPAPFRTATPRQTLDRWLIAALPALAICAALIRVRWPLEFPSWDAHGFGARGGEANALLFPWLHGLLWALSAAVRVPGPRNGA